MKRTFAILVAFLLATPLLLQGAGDRPQGRFVIPLAGDYDLDSAAYIYLRTVGENGLPFGRSIVRPVRVKTTGSSASITAVTAASAPFALNTAPPTGGGGDFLFFDLRGQVDATAPANVIGTRLVSRVILTRADADNVTVDTAIDLSAGATFFTRLFQSGTTASDGWIGVSDLDVATFSWQIKQSDGGSIDVKVECETLSSADNSVLSQTQIYTKNVVAPYGCPSATGSGACDSLSIISPQFDRCRLGFKINTDSSDAGANLEKISAQFSGRR